MVWGGATIDAIARLKQMQKSLGSKRSSIRPHELGGGPSRESFDCMFLCDVCGYLCDSDPPCPSCGGKSWIDLDYWALAEALRAREEAERKHPPDDLKWQIRLASLTTGAALALPIAPVTQPAMTETSRQKFLRQRGLFLVDGRFDLFEAILEPGAVYELQWPSAPAGAPPVIHPTTGVASRGAYR